MQAAGHRFEPGTLHFVFSRFLISTILFRPPFGGTAETESANGSPYLEVHHVIPLAEGGADAIWNAVAICANCHARCHHGRDRNEFTTRLYNLVPQLRLPTNSRDAVVD